MVFIHGVSGSSSAWLLYEEKFKNEYNIKNVLDPFVGSGTTALEAKYIGLDFYGSDLNPLAVLLSKTKVLTINNT
ncbi:DNA methyltransferase, partial [Clostridium sp.]|uniref:DNA methyltransferase n=1 Tax=Clostridium sp. TaxID=1506 RepID=UPI002632FDE3